MLVLVQDWFKVGSRLPPGCAAFGWSIVTKHDEEDNGVDHSNWCDEEVREQLGFGFWVQAAGQGRDGGEEVRARRKEEIGPVKTQVVWNP
jgi:hypothetical protein